MTRFATAALAAAVFALSAPAADDKDQPIKGTWAREADGTSLTLTFKTKDKLVAVLKSGDGKLTVTCKYTADKDGKVKAEVTETDGDLPNKPEKGFTFEFTFKVDGKTAKLTDFKAEGAEGAKEVTEGDYKKKED